MFAFVTLLVDLMLFGAYERALVNVWVDFNVGVVTELEGVLRLCQPRVQGARKTKPPANQISSSNQHDLPTCYSQQASWRWCAANSFQSVGVLGELLLQSRCFGLVG
jgi:hypothetical protein